MMRSGNPALNSEAFRVAVRPGEEVMTIQGTTNKTGILLLLCVLTASFAWGSQSQGLMILGAIGGLILALVTIFKKEWAPYTAPAYALCEGLFLGAVSAIYEARYPGIVFNAISLTFAIMAVMLGIYRYKIIKVTDNLRIGIAAATGAIFLVYLVGFIMNLFGSGIPMIHGAGPIGIGFSLVVVGIAAFNLLLDFDFIEKASETGRAPKYMEWFGAFGLMVTLIWLYIELLRLLSKLNRR